MQGGNGRGGYNTKHIGNSTIKYNRYKFQRLKTTSRSAVIGSVAVSMHHIVEARKAKRAHQGGRWAGGDGRELTR
jgi:hypothetical protein